MIGKTLALGAQVRTTSPRTWAHGGQAGKLRAVLVVLDFPLVCFVQYILGKES